MSNSLSTEMAGENADEPIPVGPQVPLTMKDAIFTRQLAEVYLLIDNVSNFPNKEIPRAPENNKPFEDAFGDDNWLMTITNIPWPPHVDVDTQKMAAQLIFARDLLNNAAAPANSMTIAFTQMVFEQRRPALLRMFRRGPAVQDDRRSPNGRDPGATTQESLARDISNGALGRIAYGKLRREAASFLSYATWLAFFMIVFTIITFALSWTVATGSELVANELQARTEFASASASVLTAEQSSAIASYKDPNIVQKSTPANLSPSQPGAPKPNSTIAGSGGDAPPVTYGYTADIYCRTPPAPALIIGSPTSDPDWLQIQRHSLCAAYARAHARLAMAESNLAEWNAIESRWFMPVALRYLGMAPLPIGHGSDKSQATAAPPCPKGSLCDIADTDTQWTATWVHVMGGIILPIFYGVLGAGVAAGRSLSAKLRDNTLSPRDGLLSWVYVGLGSIIGGCIGLIITPSDVATAPAINHLSTSALCFLAGFSVDGVFQMLERLSAAAFNNQPPAQPKKH